tara:strand:+ start:1615 stop:2409 length:795 start_codon:yes stop_codon:yes gene_type:complete
MEYLLDQNYSPGAPGTPNVNITSVNEYKKFMLNEFIKDKSDRLLKGKNKKYFTDLILSIKNKDDIQNYYKAIMKEFNAEYLFLRYNQQIDYFNDWIKKSDQHYWITIIRNPYDRAVSNRITHNWSDKDICNFTSKYGEIIEKIYDNEKFILLYYEDLVDDSEKEIKNIADRLNIKYDKIIIDQLIGSDNKLYRSQGSNLVLKGKDHREGEEYNGIYSSSVNKDINFIKKHLSKNVIEKLHNIICKYPTCFQRYKDMSLSLQNKM